MAVWNPSPTRSESGMTATPGTDVPPARACPCRCSSRSEVLTIQPSRPFRRIVASASVPGVPYAGPVLRKRSGANHPSRRSPATPHSSKGPGSRPLEVNASSLSGSSGGRPRKNAGPTTSSIPMLARGAASAKRTGSAPTMTTAEATARVADRYANASRSWKGGSNLSRNGSY